MVAADLGLLGRWQKMVYRLEHTGCRAGDRACREAEFSSRAYGVDRSVVVVDTCRHARRSVDGTGVCARDVVRTCAVRSVILSPGGKKHAAQRSYNFYSTNFYSASKLLLLLFLIFVLRNKKTQKREKRKTRI